MKKASLVVLGAFTMVFLSFKLMIPFEPSNSTAEVVQVQGCYIFSDSKPVREYKYLGTVKSRNTSSGQYQAVRDNIIKKIKKEYPEADGIILNLHDGGVDIGDAIKFK